MKRVLQIITGTMLFLVMGLALSSSAFAAYKVGVLAKRGMDKAIEQWGPMVAYITEKTGTEFTLVPLNFVDLETAIQEKRVDFFLANSAIFVHANEKYGAKALLTMMNERLGYALQEFGGVLISRKDSGITTLNQMRGKRFMCVKYTSFGGSQMAWRLLLQNNIDPKKDLSNFTEGQTHDNVVMAVQKGLTDVGTVRTDTLERMQNEGLIQINEFNIINSITSTFPFVRSTQLYPEWPFAVLPHVDKDVFKAVAKALMLMPADHPANKAAMTVGWTYAADYTEVRKCLKETEVGLPARK